MKNYLVAFFLFISLYTSSQINSPNGNNYFIYNGLADVTMRYLDRGNGGRAIVHDTGNILTLNYGGDFTGGTYIGPNTYFSNTGNSFINTGNLGIGTTTPNSKLVVMEGVDGSSLNSGGIGFNRNVQDGAIFNAAKSAWQFQSRNEMFTLEGYNGAPHDLFTVLKNGNVGVGLVAPSEKFEIYNSDILPGVLSLRSNRNDAQNVEVGKISAKQGTTEVTRIGMLRGAETTSGYFTFWTKNNNAAALTEKMRIDGIGNVGIGNLAPNNLLSVKGSASNVEIGQYSYTTTTGTISTTNYGAISFNKTEALSTSNYALSGTNALTMLNAPTSTGQIKFNINNGTKVTINNSGYMGIGTTSPAQLLDLERNADYQLRIGNTVPGQGYNIGRNGTTGYFTFYGDQAGKNGYTFGGIDGTRMLIAANGAVGIGEANPKGILHISGIYDNSWVYFCSNAGLTSTKYNPRVNYGLAFTWNYSAAGGESIINYSSNVGSSPRLDFTSWDGTNLTTEMTLRKGNLGIGTTAPKAKLDVASDISGGQTGTVFGRMGEGNGTGDGTYLGVKGYETQITPVTYNGKSFALEHHFYGKTNNSINFFRGGGETGGFMTFNTNDNTEKMRIDPYGNIMIGTKMQAPNSILTVNGKITAEEVEIKDVAADFVFQKDYQLKPLHEVESYINENQHLPGVAPASETVKGVELSKFNTLLLQKVEELTLYMIQLKKENEVMKAQIKAISKQ